MKICPNCQQRYPDDSLNFCLTDGTVLKFETSNAFIQPAVPARKQSTGKSWLWVIGIVIGVFGLITAVFFLLIFGIIATMDSNTNTSDNGNLILIDKNSKIGKNTTNTNNNNAETVKSRTFSESKTDNFSTWFVGSSPSGKSSYSNGKLSVSPRGIGYYWILLTGDLKFQTADKTTKITVKNINDKPTDLGFGLVFHSKPDKAIEKDYAFLIDSVRQVYRIVSHRNQQETIIKDWTDFNGIKNGTDQNELEIRDENGKTDFFINGEPVATLETDSMENGIAGVYTSDGVTIVFSDLKIGN